MKKSIAMAFSFLLLLSGIAYADLDDGLVAYYPFNGNANDTSGNGNHGTVNGGATLTTDRFGNANSAYNFDGVDDYISVPDNSAWTFGSDPFTISTWVKFNVVRDSYIIGHDEGTGMQNKWILMLWHVPDLSFHVNTSTENLYPVQHTWWPTPGNWYFLAVTRSGDDYMLYIDNSLVATGSDSHTIPDADAPLIIGNAEGTGCMFNGLIDDVRIYNRALSEDEILELYNGVPPPPDLDDVYERIEQLESQMDTLIEQNAALQTQLENLLGAYEVLEGRTQDLESDVSSLVEQNTSLQQRLTDLEEAFLNHRHSYLTGNGIGHNNTGAYTGPSE